MVERSGDKHSERSFLHDSLIMHSVILIRLTSDLIQAIRQHVTFVHVLLVLKYDPYCFIMLGKLPSKEEVLLQAVTNPKILIGWMIHVRDVGQGTVVGVEKNMFRSTVFKVKFQVYDV